MKEGGPWYRITMRVLGIMERLPWGQWASNAKDRRRERQRRRALRKERRKP